MRLSSLYSSIISTRRAGMPTHREVRDDFVRAYDARFISPLAR